MSEEQIEFRSYIRAVTLLSALAQGIDESEQAEEQMEEILGEAYMGVFLEYTLSQMFSENPPSDEELSNEMEKHVNELHDDVTKNMEAVIEEVDQYLASTSQEKKISIVQTVHSVLNADNIITKEEQEFLDVLMKEHNITMEELNSDGFDFDFDAIAEELENMDFDFEEEE